MLVHNILLVECLKWRYVPLQILQLHAREEYAMKMGLLEKIMRGGGGSANYDPFTLQELCLSFTNPASWVKDMGVEVDSPPPTGPHSGRRSGDSDDVTNLTVWMAYAKTAPRTEPNL